jgi:hypothetical protein
MRPEDDPQSGQDRFVVINEKQFNGCQGETPCAGCTQTVSPGKQAVEQEKGMQFKTICKMYLANLKLTLKTTPHPDNKIRQKGNQSSLK